MSSRAGQLVTTTTWGGAPEGRRAERRRARVAARFAVGGWPGADAVGAALVLGGSLALWAAVLAAVW